MRISYWLIATFVTASVALGGWVVSETHEISKVPSEFPVGFSLLSTPARQYVAYYDAERNMTVASRLPDSATWIYQKLPSRIEWDSHNYVTMALDGAGHLHVSGNMHCVPLVYFRTERPGDITSLKPARMTGELEDRVTYPKFFEDNKGRLIFTYRHGGSGSGITFSNSYDVETKTWSRLLDTPLFDGEGMRNAYPAGPTRGPDGRFHVHWVWRDTPDCATNQHLSYARSRDLIHWESAFGDKVDLPIRFDQSLLLVDPVPAGGGIINGGHRMEFDSKNKPVFVYHKSDGDGNMQIFAACVEGGKWKHQSLTDWKRPVVFSGNGSMGFIGIRIGDLKKSGLDAFVVTYDHKDYGRGALQFDARTLRLLENQDPTEATLPGAIEKVESDFPGMEIRRAEDSGTGGMPDVRYLLQWETLGANRDRPRQPPLPTPSTLRLYKLTRSAAP